MRSAIAALLTAAVLALPAFAGQAAQRPTSCFFVHQFASWKAPDARTIYISVRPNHIYRLDLAASCPPLVKFNARLHTRFFSDSVCSSSDWDLQVSRGPGTPVQPCLVKKMTELSKAEADAIPAKFKPHF